MIRNIDRSMNSQLLVRIALSAVLASGLGGCLGDPNRPGLTNPRQPGPAIGQAVGGTVGAVGGNVAGAVVGIGEGATAAARAPFNNTRRVIRTWRQETTRDGRVIQVPVDIEIDSLGRPIESPKPAKK
jgi:hypothetical protein